MIAAVAIGRNEGARLAACLASLDGQVDLVVYVDSGSTDGSFDIAHAAGAEVVALTAPFSAARARNAGVARVREIAPDVQIVLFLDGDCTLEPGFVGAAGRVLDDEPDVAAVCGRRREQHPEASLWNRMIDAEWDTPVGEARACGGDVLVRVAALEAVGGFRETMIAGEEPEMCFRMRRVGWRVRRIAVEMTRHDAAMTSVWQWWRRCRRAGHAFAEGAALHGRDRRERYNRVETRRAVIWGLGVPVATALLAVAVGAWAIAVLLAWPMQAARLWLRGMRGWNAVFLVAGKLPECLGVLGFWANRGRERKLIEYK